MQVLPQQAEVLAYRGRLAAVRGGIRSGKSLMFANWMHDRMERYPDAQHFVVGADLPQLKRGFLRTFTSMLYDYGIPYDYGKSEGVITLRHSGARLEALSAETDERIRSSEFDSVLLEEPQTWRAGEEVFRVVMGRLSGSPAGKKYRPQMQPQMRMSFNPSGVGSWLWEVIEKQQAMPCWQFSVYDNYLMPEYEEYIALQKKILPPQLWPVELGGEWATFGGNCYRGFESLIHGREVEGLPPIALDPNRSLMWSLDFNIGHMASVISQMCEQQYVVTGYEQPAPGMPPVAISRPMAEGWQDRVVYVLDEIALKDATVADALAEFLNRYGDWLRKNEITVRLYGDASGGNRNQQTIISNWEVVMHGLSDAGIAWEAYIPANGPEWDRVNAMNAQFRTGAGYGLLVNMARCPELVTDWLNVKAVEGKNKIDKDADSKRTHWSDALGYAVLTEQRIARREDIHFLDFMGR